jgi:predicted dehydrogenase
MTTLPYTHLEKPLRIAIIGLGSVGQRYAKYFSGSPDLTIHGCDPRGDQVFNVHTGWQSQSVDELLKQVEPTLAFIATPASTHLDILGRIKNAHPLSAVLMQKPISDRALTPEEISWCRDLKGLNAIGYCWRLHPFAKHLWSIRDGIRNITLQVEQDMTQW